MTRKLSGSIASEDPYQVAAEKIRKHACRHADRLEETGDVDLVPEPVLPIDDEVLAVSAPKARIPLVFRPEVKGGLAWTGNLHMAVYFWLEHAFAICGVVASSNRSGLRKELEALRDEMVTVVRVISRGKPVTLQADFQRRLNLAFRNGILGDRRKERRGYLIPLHADTPPDADGIRFLIELLESDIAELSVLGRGRPPNFQKNLFVREIAKLWTRLTGRAPSPKVNGRFDHFLKAAWGSGFGNKELSEDFFASALKRLRAK